MLNTPECLQQRFKIEPEKGRGNPVARVLFAFKGTSAGDKRRFLTTTIPMTVHGALPCDGRRRAQVRQLTQNELGAGAGISRETLTRRISRLAPEAESDRRKRPAQSLELMARNRRFAEPNIYAWNPSKMPERRCRYQVVRRGDGRAVSEKFYSRERAQQSCDESNARARRDDYQVRECPVAAAEYNAPELAQLVASSPDLWDGTCTFANGIKEVPGWIWDARLTDPDDATRPLGEIPRLVMTFYAMCGLLEERPTSHARGEVNPRQDVVARLCGISVKSVYLANRKLERLGLIRVVQDRIPGEQWKSRPASIIFLPMRTFSAGEAEAERQRFKQLLSDRLETQRQATGNPHPPAWMATACRVHQDVLGRTEGKQIPQKTYYRMLSAALLHAGLKRDLVRSLAPISRT